MTRNRRKFVVLVLIAAICCIIYINKLVIMDELTRGMDETSSHINVLKHGSSQLSMNNYKQDSHQNVPYLNNNKSISSDKSSAILQNNRNIDRNSTANFALVESKTENITTDVQKDAAPDYSCDSECVRFRKLLEEWPIGKPKSALYLLTQAKRIETLRQTLASYDKYFNEKYKYPIIIFHEKDLRPFYKTIRQMTVSDIYFQEIEFSIPEFITEPVVFNIPCISHVGYRHMCRFHSKTVYELPIMQALEYYWRLDDDSLLLKPVTYDVFVYMRDNKYEYGYSWIFWDSNSCVTGLWEATSRFIRENKITPYFFASWRKPQIFYNNFEITSSKLWLSQDYKYYIDFVDRLGGIYYHRWGDAPIKSLAVSVFLPQNKTYLFQDIDYKHNSYKRINGSVVLN